MKTGKFSKRALSLILSIIMAFSLIPASQANADDSTAEDITVYVTVSDKGTLATAKDGSYMANVPVTVSGEDIVLDDVLAALHETYYTDGSDGYYSAYNESWGSNTVYTLWGDTSGAFGFYRNNIITSTVDAESVSDGDYITAFIYSDQTYWSDSYAYFDTNEMTASIGEEITFALNSYSYDDSWNLVSSPLEGAKLNVYREGSEDGFTATEALTDEYGEVEYAFTEAGTYIVTASSETAVITAPVCVVTVVAGVEIEVTMNAVSTTMTLQTEDGEAVDVGTPESMVYTFYAEPGEYVLTAYGTDGETVSGTIGLTVSDSSDQSFNIYTVTAYANNSGFVYGTDYVMEAVVYSKTGELRTITMGDSVTSGRKTFLVYSGDTYKLTKTPIGDNSEDYATLYTYGTVTKNANNTTAIPVKQTLSVTIPSDSYELQVGTLSLYYVYNTIDATQITENEDGTVTYTYSVAKNSTYYYRVSDVDNNDAVTYVDWIKISADSEAEVTESDMYVNINDGTDYDSDTIIDDLSVNTYDVADIYLNINEKGYLKLDSGETFQIVNVRNWLPIEGISNAQAVEPDFHYTVIDGNGNASDVVTVDDNGVVTANKSGTAIVLVTYDSVINNKGMGGYTFFSAIWPENTGVFVVSVDDDTSFDTGMTINDGINTTTYKLSGDSIDAELDVLYYLKGDDGAEYTFTPEEGTTVSVLNPILTESSLTYAGYDDSNVTYNEDGSITIGGLTEGRNIVKLVNGDSTEYQVITAKETDYTISATDSDGNEVDMYNIQAGDTVTVVFDTIYHPANKLSGFYNMTAKIKYTTTSGDTVNGTANQYTFAATEAAQTVTFTIPEDYEGNSYNLTDGVIVTGGYGSAFGAHRYLTYTGGKPADFTAVTNASTLCSLPDITIALATEDNLAPASEFDDKVSALGQIYLSSADTISSLRAEYESLSDIAKAHVTTYDQLVLAEEILSELQAEKEAADAAAEAAEAEQERLDGIYFTCSLTLYTAGNNTTKTLGLGVGGDTGSSIKYTSSNTSVATVNSKGKITAKKAGKAVITASVENKTIKYNVTVKTQSLKLNKSKLTLYTAGTKTATLKATVKGASGEVTWKSSKTSVATVSSKGKVTAKKAGKTTISATANGITKKCTVTVKKAVLKLKKTSGTVKKGGKLTIKITKKPTGKVTYKSSNSKVATVNSKGVVKGKKKGTATITVKCSGLTKKFKVTVK